MQVDVRFQSQNQVDVHFQSQDQVLFPKIRDVVYDSLPDWNDIIPHIGESGNWFLGENDTGKPSRGETGAAGSPGLPGADGEDGGYYTPTVTQIDEGTLKMSFAASQEGMPAVQDSEINLYCVRLETGIYSPKYSLSVSRRTGDSTAEMQSVSWDDGEDGGFYTPTVTQVDANSVKISFARSKPSMPSVRAVTVTLPAGKDGINGQDGLPGPQGEPGIPGQDGHTPVKGVDYWTQEDKLEIMGESLMPVFVDAIEEMTDQNKSYVLTGDGMVYTYGDRTEIVRYNAYDPAETKFNCRLSSSGGESARNGMIILPYAEVDLSSAYHVTVSGVTLTLNYGDTFQCTYYDSNKARLGMVTSSPTSNNSVYTVDIYNASYASAKYVRIVLCVADESTSVNADYCQNLIVEFENRSSTTTIQCFVSTGLAYAPADYEARVINCETIAGNHEDRIVALERGVTTAGTYPSCWDSAVRECISKIKALQVGRNCVTFPFFSDNHHRLGYAGALIARVMEECYLPYCIYGGDSIDSGYLAGESVMIAQDQAFDEMMKAVPNSRLCRAVGNHDGYWAVSASENHTYTRDQIYELFLREAAVSQHKCFGEDGTYYYVDDLASKTRFIVLNSNGGFGESQRNWVQNIALQFAESGWAAVFISHAPVTNHFHSAISDAQAMQGILTAYLGASNANKADVVGWFSGHIHRDRIYQCDATGNTTADDQTTVTLPWKTVTITSDHTGIAYDDATKHTVAEDTQSHAIDFVTINKNTRTVSLTRLGIGSDRSFDY